MMDELMMWLVEIRSFALASLLALACMVLAGCQTQTRTLGVAGTPFTQPPTHVTNSGNVFSGDSVTADEALGTDPCAQRLQNIQAAMLLYYSIKGQLPPRLEDLVSLASGDLNLACPESQQEYLYYRSGLALPGGKKRIIVSDPTPAHAGKRWCIFMADPQPGTAQSLEVIEVSEVSFKSYQPQR